MLRRYLLLASLTGSGPEATTASWQASKTKQSVKVVCCHMPHLCGHVKWMGRESINNYKSWLCRKTNYVENQSNEQNLQTYHAKAKTRIWHAKKRTHPSHIKPCQGQDHEGAAEDPPQLAGLWAGVDLRIWTKHALLLLFIVIALKVSRTLFRARHLPVR